ncbi:MAG TPA: GlxA family transcriptional regulator [Mycobacteriales bacterium]|nr:GlxA family transcriptional regulator [Mycobacteriales bacterium]
MSSRLVVIIAYPGLQPLDVVGPHEVFAGATRVLHGSGRGGGYRLSLVSRTPQEVVTESGLRLGADPLPAPGRRLDTLLIPGGLGVQAARSDPVLVDWIRRAAGCARRTAAVCSGAFLAAEAGLLDGRTVTTHWARAALLAADFPAVRVDADPIYLRDGPVWTSAGVTAGIDLALAMVGADYGAEVAQTVARWLVMFLHRPGGQTQFAAPVWTPRAEHGGIRAAQAHIEADPGGDHRVPALARVAAMSPRHFARLFTEEVGESPGRYVERVRIEAARQELETTTDTLDVVARRCGLGTAETLRRTMHRRHGVSPDAYRRRFRVA